MKVAALVREAVRANVRASANHLRHGFEVLERLIDHDGLLIVGAEHSLESGGFISSTPRRERASPRVALLPVAWDRGDGLAGGRMNWPIPSDGPAAS